MPVVGAVALLTGLASATRHTAAAEAPTGEATVASEDTSVTVRVIDNRPALAALVCRSSGFDWVGGATGAGGAGGAGAAPIPLLESAEVGGKDVPVRWAFRGVAPTSRPGGRALRFACDNPPLELESAWDAPAGPGPVEHRITIRNRGKEAVLLPVQTSLAFAVRAPYGHALEQWWVDKGAGTPTADGTHRRVIEGRASGAAGGAAGSGAGGAAAPANGPGAAVTVGPAFVVRCWPSGRDNPRDAIPWTCVQDVQGRQGWYAGVEYTARVWMSLAAHDPEKLEGADKTGGPDDAVRAAGRRPGVLDVRIGLAEDDKVRFVTRVLPGERFEAPPVFVGCYRGDVDDGANRLRRWVRAEVVPPATDRRYPLLVNNSWGSGMAVDERLARRMIDESADLGLEMFHIDAGWFRGVGDWRPDPKKFPDGLAPVADYAHQKGLRFGLWVGWTQGGNAVDPTGRHGILSVRDPHMADWFCEDHAAGWKPGEFTGATVCLAVPEAADWCLDTLRSIVKDARLDLLEHDQTMVPDGCARDERQGHRHTRSRVDVGYRAAQGYYRVYDALRAENPNLLFENCVNGGHMVDYGALRRCHYISITDTYDPLSNRRAFYDASFALPPAACECYVENVPARSPAHFRYVLRSGMMGWCTIMTDTSKWTKEQHDSAKRLFALYKQRLRPLIQSADLYHVSDRPDGVHWDGVEYYDPQAGQGALFAFRGTGGEANHAFVLKGLDPSAKYALTFEDGPAEPVVLGGADLMKSGVQLKLGEPESSEIVHLTKRPEAGR